LGQCATSRRHHHLPAPTNANQRQPKYLNETKKPNASIGFPHPSSVAQHPCTSAASKYASMLVALSA
jgi:hypothetical protein